MVQNQTHIFFWNFKTEVRKNRRRFRYFHSRKSGAITLPPGKLVKWGKTLFWSQHLTLREKWFVLSSLSLSHNSLDELIGLRLFNLITSNRSTQIWLKRTRFCSTTKNQHLEGNLDCVCVKIKMLNRFSLLATRRVPQLIRKCHHQPTPEQIAKVHPAFRNITYDDIALPKG